MADPRIERLAKLLVEYSTQIMPGDRVIIEAEPAAEILVRALFERILEAGGNPHLLVSLSGMVSMTGLDDVFLRDANEDQLSHVPIFYQHAYENFEARIRIHSATNSKTLTHISQEKKAQRRVATGSILQAQMDRGDRGDFRWLTTLFPTAAYAQDAEMSLTEFEDFVYHACHVDDPDEDPIAHWQGVETEQAKVIEALKGHKEVTMKGPQCDLSFSIKDRVLINACGRRNMPDGEIYTAPVERSVEGWVQFSLPAVYGGMEVEGVKLSFSEGRVVEANATKNQAFLEEMLETDDGARYLGEFAIGTNYNIQHRTRNILFDEKIGGTFHLALGAGYPKTGSINRSAIHWDMISDLGEGGEIAVDGDVVYRDGSFQV